MNNMLKIEMTSQQLANRNKFIRELITAGWDPGGWEQLFEGGARLTPEAQAEYRNVNLDLRLSYYVSDGYLRLECLKKDGSKILGARLHPKEDNLIHIVDIVISQQNILSRSNFLNLIKKMTPYCSNIFLESSFVSTKVP